MRTYVVTYFNEFFIEASITVQAISTYAAKWVAVSTYGIPREKIISAV